MKVKFENETVIAQTPDGAIVLVEDEDSENYFVVWNAIIIWKDANFGSAAKKFADTLGDWEPNGGSSEGDNPFLARNIQMQ